MSVGVGVRPGAVRAPGTHLAALDGVRTVAIALVIVLHVGFMAGVQSRPSIGWVLTFAGNAGVPVFFVLSGLLMYRPWARVIAGGKPGPGLLPYFWRRAVRILPAYWVLLVFAMLVYNWSDLGSLRIWVEMLTFTQELDLHASWRWDLGPIALGPIWSLTVEAGFYLLLPIMAWGLRKVARGDPRRAVAPLVAGIVLPIAATYLVRVYGSFGQLFFWEHVLPRSLPYFAAGMLLALCVENGWFAVVGEFPGVCWVGAAVALVLCVTPLAQPAPRLFASSQTPVQAVVMMSLQLAAAVLVVGPVALRPDHPLAMRVLGNRVVAWIGSISYGIYLWHLFVVLLWNRLFGFSFMTGNFWPLLIWTAGCGILFGWASYALVERPVHRLRRLVPG